jgi:hypothetical protein
MLYGCAGDAVETRISRMAVTPRFFCEHADADRAWYLLPVGDDIADYCA